MYIVASCVRLMPAVGVSAAFFVRPDHTHDRRGTVRIKVDSCGYCLSRRPWWNDVRKSVEIYSTLSAQINILRSFFFFFLACTYWSFVTYYSATIRCAPFDPNNKCSLRSSVWQNLSLTYWYYMFSPPSSSFVLERIIFNFIFDKVFYPYWVLPTEPKQCAHCAQLDRITGSWSNWNYASQPI